MRGVGRLIVVSLNYVILLLLLGGKNLLPPKAFLSAGKSAREGKNGMWPKKIFEGLKNESRAG